MGGYGLLTSDLWVVSNLPGPAWVYSENEVNLIWPSVWFNHSQYTPQGAHSTAEITGADIHTRSCLNMNLVWPALSET